MCAELKPCYSGVKSYFIRKQKSGEVKWRKQISELRRVQVTPSPFFSGLLHQASFSSGESDGLEQCSLLSCWPGSVCILWKKTMKERIVGQLCHNGLSKWLGFRLSQVCLLVSWPTIQVILDQWLCHWKASYENWMTKRLQSQVALSFLTRSSWRSGDSVVKWECPGIT